jgi:hypothetical protein
MRYAALLVVLLMKAHVVVGAATASQTEAQKTMTNTTAPTAKSLPLT